MSSSILLIIALIYVLILISDAVNPVCIWNRYNLYDRDVNGLYRHAGEWNDKPFWKLDRSSAEYCTDYYWLYFVDTLGHGEGIGWHIGWGSNGIFGFDQGGYTTGTVAWCDNPSASVPWACGNNWQFADENNNFQTWTTDSAVFANEGACPILNCASLNIPKYGRFNSDCSSSDGTINAVPYTQIGDNMYTANKADGGYSNRVWFFNEPEFQWQCINTDTHSVNTRCGGRRGFNYSHDGLINYALYQGWQDVSDGQSISISNVYGIGGCNSNDGGPCTATIECNGVATTTTFPPTTNWPTMGAIPTPRPTFKPITPSPLDDGSTPYPTLPTAPTTRGGNNNPTAPTTNQNNQSGGDDDGDILGKGPGGLDWLWWILIILLIICICIICVILIIKLCQRRKKRAEFVEMYGDDNNAGGYGQQSYAPNNYEM